jgi:tetratricopeptide (TPR) repeat protein
LVGTTLLSGVQAFGAPTSSQRSLVLFPLQGGPAEQEQIQIDRLTEALQAALQETGRFEVLLFHPQAPLVRRALAQGTLTLQQLADPAEPDARLAIAGSLGVEAVLSGEVQTLSFTFQPKSATGVAEVNLEIREVQPPRLIAFHTRAEAQVRVPRGRASLRTAAMREPKAAPTSPEAAQRQALMVALARTLVSRIEEYWPVRPEAEPPPAESSTAPSPPEPLANPLEEARQRAAAGDLAAASRAYTAAIVADPGNPALYVELGEVLAKGGRWEEARNQYQRALHVDSHYLPAYRRLAEAYRRLRQPKEEIATWQRLIALGETGEEVERALGRAYLADGDYAEAVAHYERAIPLAADPYPLLIELGQWAEERQDLPTAAARYEAALALRPQDPAAHRQLLAFHLRHRESAAALARLRQFLELGSEGNPAPDLGEDLSQPVLYLLDGEAKRLEGRFEKLRQEYQASDASKDPIRQALEELDLQAQDLVNLADRLPLQEPYRRSHRHRVLSYSLLDQAVVEYLQFLEAGEPLSRERSTLLLQQFREELDTAQDLERQAFRS